MKKPKKERKKFRISALTALMLRFGILLFVLIFSAMVILTVHVAKDLLRQWEEYFASYAGDYYSPPDTLTRVQMLEKCWAFEGVAPIYYDSSPSAFFSASNGGKDFGDLAKSLLCYDTAMTFSGVSETISAGSHIYIDYITEETWNQCSLKPDGQVLIPANDVFKMNPTALKLRGYFHDGFFIPVYVAYYESPTEHQFLQSLPQRDQAGYIKWKVAMDNTDNSDQELVTLYTTDIHSIYGGIHSLGYVKIWDNSYSSVQKVAETAPVITEYGLWQTVFVERVNCLDEFGRSAQQNTVLRCYPLKLAMHELGTVYRNAFAVFVILLTLYYITLKRQLRDPLRRISTSGEDFRPLNWGGRSRWREVAQLEDGYELTQKTIHDLRQENQQLRTALEYAQEAEVRRRDLVSGITHDLKTPLAIIHSYAEGLEAGIAPEKQSQYLQTILDEADRMDSMVLEMLDFSRLEAGKVTLASDQFSLLALTKRVFDRLDLQVQEKNLAVHFDIAEDFLTTADEARIEQVVTNFATNAIKFSPECGEIHLNIFQHTGKTMFTIANQCENLPEETLERIWDSFYRADSSRTVKGTGLGLPIARAVIHLHRGTCEARNTSTGIEFRFTLPQ